MMLKFLALLFVANVFAVYGATSEENAAPIVVELFYEALCPYCSKFIKGQLAPAWRRLHNTGILKVKLHAYGNAKAYRRGDGWVFSCQHGPTECALNLLTTCAFAKIEEDQKVPFVECIEKYPYVTWGKYCLRTAGVSDTTAIYQCIGSVEGQLEQKKVADIQARLNPRLRFVPWIVVDGVHTSSIQSSVQRDMVRYVCNAYQGAKPAECNGYLDEE